MKEEQMTTKGVVWVKYTERGQQPVIAKCRADTFDVLEWVFRRMDAEA